MCKTEKCYKAFFQPGSHQIPSSEEYNLCRQVSVAPTDQGKYQGDVCSFRIVYSVCVCMHLQFSPFTTILCQAFDYELSDDDMKMLMSCNNNWRGFPMKWWVAQISRFYIFKATNKILMISSSLLCFPSLCRASKHKDFPLNTEYWQWTGVFVLMLTLAPFNSILIK